MTTTLPVDAEARPPVVDRSTLRSALLAIVVVGLAVDVVGHVGLDGIGGALLALALTATAIRGGRRAPRIALLAGVLVAAVGVGTALRTSSWMLIVDWGVVALLLPLLGGLTAGHRLGHTRLADALRLFGRWLAHLYRAPVALTSMIRGLTPPRSAERSARAMAVARGALIAAPLVIVTTVLLASADAVFASFLRLPFSVGGLAGHLVLILAGAWLATTLILQAGDQVSVSDAPFALSIRATEITVVLSGLDVVFGLFAAARSVALFRGADYVQRTTHLTYADYARSGFFQLLAVAAISATVLLAIVGAAGGTHGATRRRLVVLGEIGVALTLVIVLAAIRRLGLYQDRFGLTMLRLACTWTAWWLGAVFILIGAAIAGVGRSRSWLTPTLLGALIVGVIAANVANPAAVVARADVNRARVEEGGDVRSRSGGLDVDYLISLGDDAEPVLLAHLGDLPAEARDEVVDRICQDPDRYRGRSWLDANLSAAAAEHARHTFCLTG